MWHPSLAHYPRSNAGMLGCGALPYCGCSGLLLHGCESWTDVFVLPQMQLFCLDPVSVTLNIWCNNMTSVVENHMGRKMWKGLWYLMMCALKCRNADEPLVPFISLKFIVCSSHSLRLCSPRGLQSEVWCILAPLPSEAPLSSPPVSSNLYLLQPGQRLSADARVTKYKAAQQESEVQFVQEWMLRI